MARPTEWRQSFNYGPVLGTENEAHLDLLVVQPGETLGAVWWTYQLQAGLFQGVDFPPGDTTTVVGLELVDPSAPPNNPLNPATTGWLWWEQAIWDLAQSASTDINWMCLSHGPQQDQKSKAMRKNDTTANHLLRVSIGVDQSGSTTNFAPNVFANVSCRALIILP